MRSRRDDLPVAAAVERALAIGVCGMGAADDDRARRRLDRFIAAPMGSFVWTRDADGGTYVGRLTGAWRHDPEGAEVDLVNVRDAEWTSDPVDAALVPAAVAQTFARGGRNFQRIHPGDVEVETAELWERLSS
ncbi:GAF domain-containing protein [Aeromicrobium sp. NPDC092404]|uniref:GAF domain-containing protein n=1 Tax=Aeromicrobium sp. NPDC092404 TaxID=3154976 RepID=UPI0034247C44